MNAEQLSKLSEPAWWQLPILSRSKSSASLFKVQTTMEDVP
jgi:hypothetical protein